jgi:hypothetical protein
MPKPVYILCSESGSEDKKTGLISHFNVIEKLLFAKVPAPEPGAMNVAAVPVQITAVWMRDEGDSPEQEFQFEIAVCQPEQQFEVGLAGGLLTFHLPLSRVSFRFRGGLPVATSGIIWVEARLRKTGEEAWQTQRYPIFTEEAPPPAPVPTTNDEPPN